MVRTEDASPRADPGSAGEGERRWRLTVRLASPAVRRFTTKVWLVCPMAKFRVPEAVW
jgi:hypothetical protein